MKLKVLIGILIMIAFITGCSDGEKATGNVMLEDVTQAMEAEGLKLMQIHPKGGTSPFNKLNDTDAATFAIDTYRMADVTDEFSSSLTALVNVYIYVFDSDKARIEGHSSLNDILARSNFVSAPSVFENKNILVIHFKSDNQQDIIYDKMIRSAIKGL